jgi:hypothetical protein
MIIVHGTSSIYIFSKSNSLKKVSIRSILWMKIDVKVALNDRIKTTFMPKKNYERELVTGDIVLFNIYLIFKS